MMTFKRLLTATAIIGFVFGGVACSSSPDSEDAYADASDAMEPSIDEMDAAAENVDQNLDQTLAEGSFDQPVAESSPETNYDDTYQDTSYQDVDYQGASDSEPYNNDVSLGASSSGLGK